MDIDDHMSESEDEEGGLRIGDIYIPPPPVAYCSTESKGSRLMIKQIVNYNFKSYYGKVVLGPLHHKFTSILGPNGSGKSNVIDSMLFVFGFRAQKIRSKKLSVLLHKSSLHPSVPYCTVDVHFQKIIDNPDGTYDVIPNSEFVISRTAYANESSCYLIDNKKVQFKEVAKLLKLNGIDLNHNRFLILQGEIEAIALMKPLEFLSYLEDIIGTSRLEEPTLKLQKRLDVLNDERDIKHKRAKLAEREMRDLEKPMNEAIEFLKQENNLAISKNIHIQKLISNKNKKLQDIKAELDEATNVLQKHDEEQNKIQTERVEIETKLKEDNKNYDKLVAKRDEFDQMLKNAITKYTEVKEMMVSTNKRRKQIMLTLEGEEKKLEQLKNLPEKCKKDIEESEKKIVSLTRKKESLEETLDANLRSLKDETKSLIEEREVFQTQLIELNVAVNDTKSELSVAESKLKILKYNETTELGKLENVTKTFEESNKSVLEKQERLKLLKTNVVKAKHELNEKQQELSVIGAKEQELNSELRRNRAKLEESSNAMQASRSRNKVLDALMKQKGDGNLPGILGRLGDLGAIDAKYDVAISTCCGRLDNIVVDTVDTAQACIEYLKQYDVGRASFIALEKVSHLANQCRTQINTPENVPRLFDCVRVEDERVRAAFYFALRDTLVANDLDQGTRIAYGAKRYRVVTLKGGVIEISGTMSGGGKTMMRGRMGQSVATKTSANTPQSNKDLEYLKQRINVILSELEEIQQNTLENDIAVLIRDIRTMENEIKKLMIDLTSLNEQLPRLKQQIDVQRKKVQETKTDPVQVRLLEDTVAKNMKAYQIAQKAADEISAKANEITNQIDHLKNEKVKDVEKNISIFAKQIDSLNTNVAKLNVQISASERNVKKAEDKIQNIKAEIVTAENLIRQSSEEHKELCQDSVQIKTKVAEITNEIESMSSGSGEVQKKIEDLLKTENQLKIQRLELEQNVDTFQKKHNDVSNDIPNLKHNLSLIKLQEIPGEQPCEPLKIYTEEELDTHQTNHLHYQVTIQEEQLKNKSPTLSVIDEYLKKKAAYVERINILEEITCKRDEIKQMIEKVNKMRYTEFMHGYNIITKKVKEMYQMITIGGDAELLLTDNMNPFTEGINYSVRPPRKSWKNITNLSGGEKTLSSLALVFALHYYNPSPLYVMDEIDAALDFKNVSIVAYYIKRRTKNAQFLIISLRSNMFELSDLMVGIYKVDDCTNSLTIKNTVPIDEGSDTEFEPLESPEKEKEIVNVEPKEVPKVNVCNELSEIDIQHIIDCSLKVL